MEEMHEVTGVTTFVEMYLLLCFAGLVSMKCMLVLDEIN